MDYKVGEILISAKEIRYKIKEIADKIRKDYSGEELVCICVLKGASVFFTDLLREIGPEVDIRMEFLTISSYGLSTKSSGIVQIQQDISTDISNKNVLIIEDIIDTGASLAYLKKLFNTRSPKSFEMCVLLDKKECRTTPVQVKYLGFTIPNKFVVGYGLDYAGKFRHLSSLHIVEPVL